jgi:hypothetical protein
MHTDDSSNKTGLTKRQEAARSRKYEDVVTGRDRPSLARNTNDAMAVNQVSSL